MSAVIHPGRAPDPERLLPLLVDADLRRTLAWRNGAPISAGQFVGDVEALARLLPTAHFAVNLCEDRYQFLVAFCAVALAGQTNLLPSSRTPQTVAETLHAYAGSYALSERPLAPAPSRQFVVPENLASQASTHVPEILAT